MTEDWAERMREDAVESAMHWHTRAVELEDENRRLAAEIVLLRQALLEVEKAAQDPAVLHLVRMALCKK